MKAPATNLKLAAIQRTANVMWHAISHLLSAIGALDEKRAWLTTKLHNSLLLERKRQEATNKEIVNGHYEYSY